MVEQHTNLFLSDYGFAAQQNMLSSSASGMFSFCPSHTGPADLAGSSWDTTVEGTQNFPEPAEAADYYTGEAEDFLFPFGQGTPKPDHHQEAVHDFQARWTQAVEHKALKAEPMRRGTSRSSTGSHKNRSTTTSAPAGKKKSRPRVQSILSQASSQMSKLDMTGNASSAYYDGALAHGRVMDVQQYLAQDLDSLSVSPQVHGSAFYPGVVGYADGLPYSGDLGAALSQHVNPQIFDAGLVGASPHSWGSLSPVDSRMSSPGIPDASDDVWSAAPSASSPGESQDSNSPPLPGQSPRYVATQDSLPPAALSHTFLVTSRMNRKLDPSQFVTSEDLHGNMIPATGLEAFALPPVMGSRRLSGEGESARDHHLYKNAFPHADGLFHCPWEGQPSCNHKPEKLKCNYE